MNAKKKWNNIISKLKKENGFKIVHLSMYGEKINEIGADFAPNDSNEKVNRQSIKLKLENLNFNFDINKRKVKDN